MVDATRSTIRVMPAGTGPRVALVLHGRELEVGGGPSVRVQQLLRGLREIGIDARIVEVGGAAATESSLLATQLRSFDVVHVFNAWPPSSAARCIEAARRAERPVVLSPILLDLALQPLWHDRLPQAAAVDDDGASLRACLAALRRARAATEPWRAEPTPGLRSALRGLVASADVVVSLGPVEEARLRALQAPAGPVVRIANAVDPTWLSALDAAAFTSARSVLCVGRIEPRKNQYLLARAVAGTGLTLVLVGTITNRAYFDLVRRTAPDLIHLDRLEPGSPALARAFLEAGVVAAPSWTEGMSLAVLEGLAAGRPVVVAAGSGDLPALPPGIASRLVLVDPSDETAIRTALVAAADRPRGGEDRRSAAFAWARRNWHDHVDRAATLYRAMVSAGDDACRSEPPRRQDVGIGHGEQRRPIDRLQPALDRPGPEALTGQEIDQR